MVVLGTTTYRGACAVVKDLRLRKAPIVGRLTWLFATQGGLSLGVILGYSRVLEIDETI